MATMCWLLILGAIVTIAGAAGPSMPDIDWNDVDHLIELRGVYDGWSAAVMSDGTFVNRWAGLPGFEGRAAVVDAFLAGEEPDGRWF